MKRWFLIPDFSIRAAISSIDPLTKLGRMKSGITSIVVIKSRKDLINRPRPRGRGGFCIAKSGLIFCVFLILTLPAAAQVICPLNGQDMQPAKLKSLKAFQKLPILEHGRIKPLDTYARNLLVQFSGRQTFERKTAIEWLAQLVFAPNTTKKNKIFLINHPSIPVELGLAIEKRRRYSFEQLEPKFEKLQDLARSALRIPDRERDVVDAELIRVYQNLKAYADLSFVFQFAFPHEDFTIENKDVKSRLGLPEETTQFGFLDIALVAEAMQDVLADVEQKSSSRWTTTERDIVGLLSNLYHWSMSYRNLPLTIVPTEDQSVAWLSPWDAIAGEFNRVETRNEMNYLRNMLVSYWNGEQIQFDVNARLYLNSIKPRLGKKVGRTERAINLEVIYNRSDLFLFAKIFYACAFLFFLCSMIKSRIHWHALGLGVLTFGFIVHAIALGMRVMILNRPPVSNLYETFIFVGFVVVLLGMVIEAINRKWLGIVTASVGGFALLMIAAKYSAEGDTLQMLIAVLNSNFWLATHVISITAGYGATCAAGILGHVYLLESVFKKKPMSLNDATYKILMGTLGLALTLTFLGTNLGGIWADQSWGRFWGWDPKENGALMIVLWSAMLFHARIANMIGAFGVAVGAVLGTIVVMWAWFGVNLLSIGLHSYGFTSGVATVLIIYVIAELIFLGIIFGFSKNIRSRR